MSGTYQGKAGKTRRTSLGTAILNAPYLLWAALFIIIPMFIVVYYAFTNKDGAFTRDCTMEEMIDLCAQFVDEVNKNMPRPMTQEEYKQMMRQYFPKLKRWESAQ